MTVEKSLNLLESKSKEYKKNKEIFDIVLYGSLAKNKREINDIDVLFIFNNLKLENRLEIIQKFKKQLRIKNLDIKSINLNELFDKTFIAKQGILTEGISLIDKKPFSEKFGFKGFGLFHYKTKNLSNTEKVRFSYALNGRRKEKGFLQKTNAKRLGKEVILVPISALGLFCEFLEKWKVEFTVKQILVSEYT